MKEEHKQREEEDEEEEEEEQRKAKDRRGTAITIQMTTTYPLSSVSSLTLHTPTHTHSKVTHARISFFHPHTSPLHSTLPPHKSQIL